MTEHEPYPRGFIDPVGREEDGMISVNTGGRMSAETRDEYLDGLLDAHDEGFSRGEGIQSRAKNAVEAVAAQVLRDLIATFGDLEWPTGEDTYSVLAVEIERWAAERGIQLDELPERKDTDP